MSERVIIYDTTLRDGSQTEGIQFSCEDKLDILHALDVFGADFVEGGWPGSNPRDDEFFMKASKADLKSAKLVAFGSTRRHDLEAGEDRMLKALAECPAEWCCIFGKSWDFQVTGALGISLDANLDIVEESVRYLVDAGKKVIFDAEHFFDGYASNPRYALNVLRAAESGGAEWLVLCDTNGGSLPSDISEAVEDVLLTVDTPLGIHCHNDSDLASACTLAAVESGCTMVQGTVNGLGERCGNANLCTVVPTLVAKMGVETGVNLEGVTTLSRYVGEVANMPPAFNMPYVGESAFAHKGGVHASAVLKDTRTYEHMDPATVGNSRRILVSDMSGKASITEKLRELGIVCNGDSGEIVDIVKEMESKGYRFEGADASFEMLVKRLRGEMEPMFRVGGFRIFMDNSKDLAINSEASIKVISRDGSMEHTAADGNGPVNALDNALRKALTKFYPELSSLRLTDYKVRVLDAKAGTGASIRVLMKSTDGTDSWTTVGVSENVIEASLKALVDSIEYMLLRSKRKRTK